MAGREPGDASHVPVSGRPSSPARPAGSPHVRGTFVLSTGSGRNRPESPPPTTVARTWWESGASSPIARTKLVFGTSGVPGTCVPASGADPGAEPVADPVADPAVEPG